MKKKYIIYPIAFIALISMFVQCKKDKPGNTSTCADNSGSCQSIQEAKDYFAFKMGSWWVYEEENSGERDSVYVTESSIDPNSYNFDVRVYSTYQDFYYHYWPEYYYTNGCNETQPVAKKCLSVKRSKYQFGNYIGEGKCFFVNYHVGDQLTVAPGGWGTVGGCDDDKIIVESILASYTISDLSFSKTVKIHETCQYMEGAQPTNHFFSSGIGLVRKELIDSNKVWNLVNYHIES